MLIAIASIYNISARESLSKSIELKISSLNSEFVSSNKVILSDNLSDENQKKISDQVNEIAKLEVLNAEINALKSYGGDYRSNLSTIRTAFVTNSDLKSPSEDNQGVITYYTSSIYYLIEKFSFLSSDMLLALALLSCGALGSVIASVRSNHNVNLSKFTIGFTSGFITYLGIKGGQFVFLLQVPGAAAVLNPYTASFVGLLSGMFSERFHLILSNFMDKATEKFKIQNSSN